MIDFYINSGKIGISESLKNMLTGKTLVMRGYDETVSCDAGLCEVVHDITVKVKRHCNDKNLLFFINGDVEIAMDSYIFDMLSVENITISKGKNLIVDRKKH
ncbi:hypothetical protein [Ferroplasma sp.]|uniref:hypothetical protein n=1 Tax=Ferroplasma sp. TaxID=2591003 RepID=UPI00307E46FB